MYKNCVHFSKDFADMIHKELFDLIWYRSKRKIDHPSGGTNKGFTKDIMDSVVGSLYNAKTTKEAVYDPSDILNLSQYNSESFLNLDDSVQDEIPSGIKRVSLDHLDDPFVLKGIS